MKKHGLLKMDLQHFAEKGKGLDDTEQGQGQGEDQGEGEGVQGENNGGDPVEDRKPVRTFTQEELDAIIADRLARERKKQEEKEKQLRDEAERKRLEENEEYKELAKKLQEQLEEKERAIAEQKEAVLKAKKETALSKAGYSAEQIKLLTKLVEGESDEEIEASIDTLKSTVPPATRPYADPGVGNGSKGEPKKKDLRDKGKSMYQRLKEKGKVRRR